MKTRPLFADTSYLIALLDRKDSLHGRALRLAAEIGADPVITTELVIIEWLNAMSRPGPLSRDAAIRAHRSLAANPKVEIVPYSSAMLRAAIEHFASRQDKAWSVTDCASFILMESRGISDALTHDRHFEQAGFRALLR